MTSHRATARLFIALDLPESLGESLSAWSRSAVRAAGLDRLRVLERDTLHLTLCFLGSRPFAEVDELASVVERAAGTLGECSLGAPLWLPRRRPRALAVEVHDDDRTLTSLHSELVERLRDAELGREDGGQHGGGRALRPHVTVARMGRGGAPRDRELPPTPQRRFTPERLVLYRSHLARDAASYEALASFVTLPPGARP